MNVKGIWAISGFSITDARGGASGQSLIEFVMLLPMIIGLIAILVRVNTAIQISIVDQQYARAQTLALTYNSAYYPELANQMNLLRTNSNQMLVGVSQNIAVAAGSYSPEAPTQEVTRTRRVQAPDQPQEEPNLRAKVRVRNSVTLCTPVISIQTGRGGASPVLPLAGSPPAPAGPSALTEENPFRNNICRSPIQYEQ